jgi:hypothetical protein
MTTDAYSRLVDDVRQCVRAHVPEGAIVLVVSRGDEDLLRIDGYRVWHFPRDEWGAYAGHHPGTSAEALAHLRHLYAEGARYLVFPETAAWWLDHYSDLAEHLDSQHALTVSKDGVCVIYELRDSPAFAACASIDDADGEPAADASDSGRPAALLALTLPAATRRLRVLSMLARFGSSQYAGAEEAIADLFARQLPDVERRVIVIDNALGAEVVEEGATSVLIGGDNGSREFSGFDRAIDFVGDDIWSYDYVHCATSAFQTLYVAYLERFEPAVLQAAAGRAVCVGHIDCYNEPIEVRGYHAQHWIRSCFLFLPPAEVKALGTFVSVPAEAPLFSGDPERPFRADAPLSPRYRDYITQWLTGAGLGQGVAWHSRFALAKDTLPAFEAKARAILNEQLLSIRLQALGCRLIDVTWLSAMLRRQALAEDAWNASWREQLANRDRDRLTLPEARTRPDRLAV